MAEVNRRRLLTAGALLGGAAAVGASADTPAALPEPRTVHGVMPWAAGAADNPAQATGTGYRFFGPDEAAFVEAAAARLIPADHNGPGALEAGVPIFLDRQLSGPFGHGDHYYLGGPWPKGLPTQGYQTRFTPAEFYRAGIKAVDAHSRKLHGKLFRDLPPADQDALLKSVESGEAQLDGVDAKAFFTLFLQNVVEGFFADPIYGGNRNMAAWRMIGFPGAHYDYSEWVDRKGQPWPHPPVGLAGRREWTEA